MAGPFSAAACLWTIRVRGQYAVTDGRGVLPVLDRGQSSDELRTRTELNHGPSADTSKAPTAARPVGWMVHGNCRAAARDAFRKFARDTAPSILGHDSDKDRT